MAERSDRTDLRNVAVVAHVDHGKTTLVDAMLRQSGQLRRWSGDPVDRVLDSFELERERGITILAKNTAVPYGGVTINILDTPGHHDFGGEVERTLIMADGVLLLVDAAEGPLPQTRFVLQKTLSLHLPVVLALNKIDRRDAQPEVVLEAVYDLFIDLGASDADIEFPVLYTDGRRGIAHRSLEDGATDLRALFEALLTHIPPPRDRREEPLQLHVNNLGYDDYVGRLIIGRIQAGTVSAGQAVFVRDRAGRARPAKVMRLYGFQGLERVEIQSAASGEIVAVAGVEDVVIGDTVTDRETTPPLPRVRVDEPTLAMHVCVNTSPFAGKEGRYVTSRKLRERLLREALANVAIRVTPTDSPDVFRVVGRGELQLGIFVETMRREGYELALSRPEVVLRREGDRVLEPEELLLVDVPETQVGTVSELVSRRKGRLEEMLPVGDRTRLVFRVPTRGLIGLGGELLTETRGQAVHFTQFEGWIPWQGPIASRRTGVLVADREGHATPYALFHLQARGVLFIGPNTHVYEGMVVGEHSRPNDIDVNVCRQKKLTNLRAAAKDDNVILSPPRRLSLEQAIDFIDDDELVEITPRSIRLRKRVLPAGRRPRKER